MDAQVLGDWLNVLDDLTYYAILGVGTDASYDTLKQAFHSFAETFHPDAHAARPAREREAVALIFKRANEAYRVLSDPALRARYDQLLGSGESQANASKRSWLPPPVRESTAPKRLEDQIRSPTARPFARRAEELVRAGDMKQAKLQLMLARHHDPNNDALEQYIRELEAQAKKP
jgi:curved DNA-binding protein CbpA